MLGRYFYHSTCRTAVAVFGSLFNNILLRRGDGKYVPVPIAYGPRSKWIEAHKGLTADEEMFEKLLPRMSYEMVALTYDVNRKLTNKQTVQATDFDPGRRQKTVAPVPYNIDFTLYIQTKNLNDGWQIVEQILPFFTPSYTVKVRHYPLDDDSTNAQPTNSFDMPFTLTNITWSDDYVGDIEERRLIEWQLEFNTKVYMYGPLDTSSIIRDSRVIIATPPPGGEITDLNRSKDQEGVEVGYIIADSEFSDVVNYERLFTFFENDTFEISPYKLYDENFNEIHSDSEGVTMKIHRDIYTGFADSDNYNSQ